MNAGLIPHANYVIENVVATETLFFRKGGKERGSGVMKKEWGEASRT